MNEFLILMDEVASFGFVYLVALLTVAVCLLVFDRRPKKGKVEGGQSERERLAA